MFEKPDSSAQDDPGPAPHLTTAGRDRLITPAEDRADGERPLADVTRELCELASDLAAATCRWLMLLAEFDRREGWAGYGVRSCAQWLSWRCALSLSTAYEQLRVAHALEELPAVRAEFAAGRLSYSKVRAISRMAGAGNEDAVLRTAQSCTAAQLDRLARAYRRAVGTEDEIERSGRRRFSWHWDDDGYLVVEGRLPPEEGAMLLAALRAAADQIESDSADLAADPDADGRASDGVAAEWPSTADSSAEESAGSTVMPRQHHRRAATIVEPTSLTPGRSVAEMTSPTEDPGLLRRAESRAREARAADALALLAETTLAHQPTFVRGEDRYHVMLHVDLDALAGGSERSGGQVAPATSIDRMHLDQGPAVSVTAAQRITCHASVVALLRGPRGQLLDVGRRTRTIPSAISRALHVRDRACCRFPGCHRHTGLEAHPVVHWARGGRTRLGNLVLLCCLHHWLVHVGGFRVEAPVAEHAAFRRPDGEQLPEIPELTSSALPATALGQTLRGTADSLTPPWWYGEPMRLAYVVSSILDDQHRRSGDPHRLQLAETAQRAGPRDTAA
ncbi:MAG: DUF222 domain-containing protein [Geodermatophilaceae bacterium]|nr:DUF222 domain-containing protein [Geodermatophilaceae bacterium]